MKIPSEFYLAGYKWTVVLTPNLNCLGQCERDRCEIQLRKGLPRQVLEAAFLHELVHAIKYTMGDAGPHNEQEVDGFANLLHQYLLTQM